MEEQLVKSVTDELNCGICMNRFRVPKMLDCIHTFCESCLEGYVENLNGKELTCPMCRKTCPLPAGVKGLQTNIYLVNMCDKIDLYEKLKSSKLASKLCESCKKNTTVTAFCIDCKYAICRSCEEHHSLFPALQSHTIERLDNNLDERKLQIVQKSVMVPTCDLHVPEKLRFYCKTCSKLICRECTVIQHPKPDHMCVEVSSQFVEVKERLSNLLRETLEQERVVSEYVTGAKSGESVIKMESETMFKVIQDRYQKVKSEIESQLKKKLKEAEKAVKRKQAFKESRINKSFKLADNWMKRMESTKDTTQKVIRENNMWELLSLSNNLIGSFNTLQDDKNTFNGTASILKLI
ncbi:E3 ubiquitin-protein ligase TRIM56-like [Apostichopus japonicus]|uniref:E3 ubiquitin-protein ligase TRIM56-like n=1 Tax=Stichopus japonicus TaxID=307972 RepID=UPI003AB36C03